MPTVKVKFRLSAVAGKEGTLFYQIIHRRMVRQVTTSWRIRPGEWRDGMIAAAPDADDDRRQYIDRVNSMVDLDLRRLADIIGRLEAAHTPYTAAQVAARFTGSLRSGGLRAFAAKITAQLYDTGRRSLADNYRQAVGSFLHFREEEDVSLRRIDADMIAAYEGWLRDRRVCTNTISFYMRNLRALYNRAVAAGVIVQRNPFARAYTAIDKTLKRAVPLEAVRRLRDLDLSRLPESYSIARDMFMFSFYTRGMAIVDMAYLRKSDLCDGILSYRRSKTNHPLSIRWEPQMQQIIDRYDTSGSPFLLPLIRDAEGDLRRQYRNSTHLVNRRLRQLGRMLGLHQRLTTYAARHGWASAAQRKRVPISVISAAMGHESERTTRIYLESLDSTAIDTANRLILRSL